METKLNQGKKNLSSIGLCRSHGYCSVAKKLPSSLWITAYAQGLAAPLSVTNLVEHITSLSTAPAEFSAAIQ